MPQQLFCSVRKRWIDDLPEERVRQRWILKMHLELGFPLPLFMVERSLHLSSSHALLPSIPQRRTDIVVLHQKSPSLLALAPLLLIECKAHALTKRALRQLSSYNYYVQAPFYALATQDEMHLAWSDPASGKIYHDTALPTYEELIRRCAIS